MSGLGAFPDATFAGQLKADLQNNDDSKRTVKEISATNAKALFAILNLDDPACDKNGDGVIKGDEELKCLNYAWKAYVPN